MIEIRSALPVGTVVKLRETDKRAVIIGILQQYEEDGNKENFDYIGVPYPEGFMGGGSTVLFNEQDIETVFFLGFSDLERQHFISEVADKIEETGK
ncbi:MAG: DUF4176 domain-containing protein [Lachnospirales bacterium]